MKHVKTIPLLDVEEEIHLSRHIQKYMQIKELRKTLAKKFKRTPTLSELAAYGGYGGSEEMALVMNKGMEARTKLVTSNLRLVNVHVNVVTKRNPRINKADLMQEGIIGLIRAAEKYDATRGRFSTYAMIWIRSEMNRKTQHITSTISVPNGVTTLKKRIDKFRRENPDEYGLEQDFTSEELAKGVGATVSQVERCLKGAYRKENSYEEEYYDRAQTDISPEIPLVKEDLLMELRRYLNDDEWAAIVLRYGLGKQQSPRTIHQVAELMHLNIYGVSKHIKTGVEKLQIEAIRSQLAPYIVDFASRR